ncbi:ABC1 family-domain-containing protein [Tribonema minus]|uniref:ABC1 family-domain-containing protein n=1 Tax=Tribonema minus TaxID=303371 RepID=A0A835Z5W4_9STRA|nr:ABC1 family-domain-containing protein [Tribonema minus]
MALKIAGRALGLSVASVGLGGAWMYEKDEGTRRAFKMYGSFAPIVMSYRALELKHSLQRPPSDEDADRDWNVLHQKFADEVLHTIRSLKGFYVKYGQVLAGRPDVLPDIYVENLRTLEDAVQEVVCSSLGVKDISEVFSEFSVAPVGSASIGQVHKARLKSTGEVVAVKVKYPDAETLFRTDMKTARGFCRIFAPEQLIMFDEIERQFMGEFDYRREAQQMERVRVNMLPFRNLVEIPKPIMDFTTREVLVMQFMEGKKLYDAIKEYGEKYAARQGKTFKDLERETRQRILQEGMPPKYAGPSAPQIERYRRALAVKNALLNAPLRAYNATLSLLLPISYAKSWRLPLFEASIPPNTARIMDTLMRVHGHQAGNVLLLLDGRLGLIDYGQVKELTDKERLHLCEVIRGLMTKDKKALKDLAIASGYKSKYFDEDVIYNMTRFALDTDGPEVTGGLNFQQFMDDQYRRDPWTDTDASIIMPVRTALMLRGIGLMLNHPVAVTDCWGPIAEDQLAKQRERSSGGGGGSGGGGSRGL